MEIANETKNETCVFCLLTMTEKVYFVLYVDDAQCIRFDIGRTLVAVSANFLAFQNEIIPIKCHFSLFEVYFMGHCIDDCV